MRLTFPNGEHAAVNIEQGQVGVGSAAGGGTAVAVAGLEPLHAVFAEGRRGRWLTVPASATVMLNARPVRRIAFLRAGDLVCLGNVQVRIEASEAPPPAGEAPAVSRRRGADEALVPRALLRGLSGPWFGRSVGLGVARSFGKGVGVDLRLEGEGIDDRHAVVDIEEGRVTLRTSGPAALVRVNGHVVRAAVLQSGDQIEIGEHRFAVEAPGLGQGVEPSTPVPSARREASTFTAMTSVGQAPPGDASPPPAGRDLGGVYLLVAAAAALAAALTAFFVYAPKG